MHYKSRTKDSSKMTTPPANMTAHRMPRIAKPTVRQSKRFSMKCFEIRNMRNNRYNLVGLTGRSTATEGAAMVWTDLNRLLSQECSHERNVSEATHHSAFHYNWPFRLRLGLQLQYGSPEIRASREALQLHLHHRPPHPRSLQMHMDISAAGKMRLHIT